MTLTRLSPSFPPDIGSPERGGGPQPTWGIPAGTWTVQPGQAEVRLQARLLRSQILAYFRHVTGRLNAAATPAGSSVWLVVHAASLDTGNRLRDEQLRSRLGLDVDRYPHITFTSAPGEMRLSAGRVYVPGTLEVRGVGHPLALAVDVVPSDDCATALHSATQIDRRALGVDLAGPLNRAAALLSNTVEVGIDVSLAHCGEVAA